MNPWELDKISIQAWVLQLDAGLEDDEEFCLVKRILGKAAVGQWMGSWVRKESPWSNRLETICGELPMTAMQRLAAKEGHGSLWRHPFWVVCCGNHVRSVCVVLAVAFWKAPMAQRHILSHDVQRKMMVGKSGTARNAKEMLLALIIIAVTPSLLNTPDKIVMCAGKHATAVECQLHRLRWLCARPSHTKKTQSDLNFAAC